MTRAEEFVALAEQQVGKPYVWATAGPSTFDCSGLVYWLASQILEVTLDPSLRSSYDQWADDSFGTRLKIGARMEAGDLLFYDSEDNGTAGHVGIYVGDGHMVNALNQDAGVVVSNINKPYWTNRLLGSKRLFSGGATTPTGQPNPLPDSKTPVAPKTGTSPSAGGSGSPLTTATPFRSIGDVTLQTWRNTWQNTPMPAGEVDAAFEAAKGYTALALTQAIKESSLGTTGNAAQKKNPLGLMLADGSTLQTFASWPLAFAEFRRRLTDPSYKGKPGPYFPASVGGLVPGWDMSFLAYIITYVGGPGCLTSQGKTCANGERYDPGFPKDGQSPNGGLVADDDRAPSINRYSAQTLRRLRELLGLGTGTPPPPPVSGQWQAVTFAGSSRVAYLPTNVVFRTVLTPVGSNRPGGRIRLTGTTQHETGNTRPGTGAVMHSTWQDNGTPGHPDGFIGVHFYVDDDMIIQKIPVNETSIHAGDARNGTHLSIERCVNTDQTPFADSEKNSAYLQAALLKYVVGSSAKESMYPHYSPAGTGNCPVNIGFHWSQYEDRVDAIIAQLP